MPIRPLTLMLALGLALGAGLAACSDGEGFRLGSLGQIELRPGAIDFVIERVELGASESQVVAVHNLGTGELRIDAVHIDVLDALGESPVVVSLRADPPLFVAADEQSQQPIRLTYTRGDDRPRHLQLVVQSSDPTHRIVKLPIDVRRGSATLAAIPAQALFAEGVATPATKTIRLINAGNAALSIQRMRLDADGFAVTLANRSLASGGGELAFDPPAIVPAGGELPLGVTFDPDDDTPVSGKVVLFGDSDNSINGFPVPLIGNQDGPCILLRPSVMSFGRKAVDSVSDIAADIENCGTVPLEITGVVLSSTADETGPSSPRFAILDAPAAWQLAPGEVHPVTVRYTAWTTADAEAHRVPALDRGVMLVRSTSRIPTRTMDIAASTDVPFVPTDIDGCEWGGGEVVKHPVEIQMTADDAYEVWVDGVSIARDTGPWSQLDTYAFELDSGCHVLGVHAWDTAAVRSGLIALIKIDGVVRWTSGDAKPEWSVSGPNNPPGNWHDLYFDDSAWSEPRACSSTSVWGTAVASLEAQGARWVWWNTDCNDLSNAWFRLTFTVD